MIELGNQQLTIEQQCELVGLSRAGYYYKPHPIEAKTLELLNVVDEAYTRSPFFGTRQMAYYLQNRGYNVGRKRIKTIYRILGLEAQAPKPKLSTPKDGNVIYPYLLRDIKIERCDQVWSTDLTYIRLLGGFVYLMAIIDWYSRFVLDWELDISLEASFCIETLKRTLVNGNCEIFNTDQGAQFTCSEFTGILLAKQIQVSMDGKGRSLDNVFVERLWRSLKYECIYLRVFATVKEAREAINNYFNFYNYERPHQSLGGKTPATIYLGN